MIPAPALVLYPDNIRRDVRHARHRLTRLTNHRLLDHMRPIARTIAAITRETLTGVARPASWVSSHPLAATGLAAGAGFLVAAAIRTRPQQTNG
ncbi:hypothetical protein [Verrucomicrobium spinosum]|nr:hypothetical protein [Verrucomicrobium spinosum]